MLLPRAPRCPRRRTRRRPLLPPALHSSSPAARWSTFALAGQEQGAPSFLRRPGFAGAEVPGAPKQGQALRAPADSERCCAAALARTPTTILGESPTLPPAPESVTATPAMKSPTATPAPEALQQPAGFLARPPAPEQRRLPPRCSSPCEQVRWRARPPSPTEPPCESETRPRPRPRRWSSAARVPGSPPSPTLQRVGLRVATAAAEGRRA